jgi:transcriptional regulator with XRE-family HTH domain
MEPDREAPGRLDAAMDKRRLEMRPPLKWTQVAERAGMSIGHLSRIRKGEAQPSKLAASQIESALDWESGTVARITGDESINTGSSGDTSPASALPPNLSDIEDPSPKEQAMLQYIASMQEQIRQLNDKVEAIAADRERERKREENGTQQKGA